MCRFDTILAVNLKFRFYLRVVALPPWGEESLTCKDGFLVAYKIISVIRF